jgi:N-acetylglucosamine-6-sulfatase
MVAKGISNMVNRRRLLQGVAALGLAVGEGNATHETTAAQDALDDPAAARPRRPDVVLIVTDDMRISDWQALPQMRALAEESGAWFPNCFVTTPGCGPSRASILTGRLAHEHGVWGVEKDRAAGITGASEFAERGLASETIAVALQDAGYRTAMIGKYLNGFKLDGRIPPGWDDWYATTSLQYVDFELDENGTTVEYRGKESYLTDVLADKAVEVIAATDPEQPLFLYVAVKAPHKPSTPAKRHADAFAEARVDDDPAVNEADVSDKPAFLRELPLLDVDKLNRDERRRLQSLLAVDEAGVRLVEALRNANRLEHAYIFLLSDNGFAMGHHRWTSKALPYDTVARVGMIAIGPGFDAGITDPRLVTNTDLAPTIADVAGVELPMTNGQSLLSGEDRSVVLLENTTSEIRSGYRALRSEHELYVEWDTGERELYDYRTDPFELDNALADWSGTPTTDALMRADVFHRRLGELAECVGDACLALERAPIDA